MRKIAIIKARSGSKGLPNKNVLMVDGKPLIAYTIEVALEANVFDDIILTTDSQEYIDLLAHYPIRFHKRPKHLALDTSTAFEAMEELLHQDYGQCDYFVEMQVTSPIRTVEQVRDICKTFEENYNDFDFMASITDAHKISVFVKPLDEKGTLRHFELDHKKVNRQNYAPEYSPNGSFFVAKRNEYLEYKNFYGPRSLGYYMDKKYSLDIDDRDDFDYFYYTVQEKKRLAILKEQALREIELKDSEFKKEADVTLIGDVILAKHSRKTDIDIQNLAILNIDIDTYLQEIINKGLIDKLSNKIIISIGINDLRKKIKTFEELVSLLLKLVKEIQQIKPEAKIYYLACLKTLFRADCDNKEIEQYNERMANELKDSLVSFIDLNPFFCDKYGKLSQKYTDDGLNLNTEGYRLLETTLTSKISS